MKMKSMFFAVAAAVALMAGAAFAYEGYGSGSMVNPHSGSGMEGPTSGDWLAPSMRDYQIGFRGLGGFCEVKEIRASSSDEALLSAHNICPTCQIEDLSGEHIRAEAPWESTPKADSYCMLDLDQRHFSE